MDSLGRWNCSCEASAEALVADFHVTDRPSAKDMHARIGLAALGAWLAWNLGALFAWITVVHDGRSLA